MMCLRPEIYRKNALNVNDMACNIRWVTILHLFLRFLLFFKNIVLENTNILISNKYPYFEFRDYFVLEIVFVLGNYRSKCGPPKKWPSPRISEKILQNLYFYSKKKDLFFKLGDKITNLRQKTSFYHCVLIF